MSFVFNNGGLFCLKRGKILLNIELVLLGVYKLEIILKYPHNILRNYQWKTRFAT